jgi:hypothetical protein
VTRAEPDVRPQPAGLPDVSPAEPDERFNRFRRFRPEAVESPSAYQPPDRSDRYADDRPAVDPEPGQVDFSRLRKFARADEEPGSHRAARAPEWATSNTWDDQQRGDQPEGEQQEAGQRAPDQPEPEPRGRGRRARRAEESEAPAEEPPAEKKSRRQQRRERKTQPDETEVWLSGLSSSEPMSWEAERPGRTAPNDGLGLSEDLAEFKGQSARPRGSLFQDGEDTWNTPAPASDDDWWESTPRRSRRDRDRKDK